jgi:hypothetical protein
MPADGEYIDPRDLADLLEMEAMAADLRAGAGGAGELKISTDVARAIAVHLKTSKQRDRRNTARRDRYFRALVEKAHRKKATLIQEGMNATTAEGEAAERAADRSPWSADTIKREMQRRPDNK